MLVESIDPTPRAFMYTFVVTFNASLAFPLSL